MALLTLLQQQAIKPISPNWASSAKVPGGVSNFVQLQTEVENKELRKLLGAAFLLDIQTNPTDPDYVILLDGTTFVCSNGDTLEFFGLRYILAYMNWSKYVAESHFADTFTGMVQKNRNEATSLSGGDIKRTQLDAQEIALQDFEIIKQYLDLNSTTYPLWNCANSKKPFLPKFTGVKRTLK